jgi:hypothetical protein
VTQSAVTAVLDAAALLVSTAALVAAATALAVTRRLRAALPVLLDLLTAAGLLRLAADPDWDSIVLAAAVVGLRHLIVLGVGLRVPGRNRSAGGGSRRLPLR